MVPMPPARSRRAWSVRSDATWLRWSAALRHPSQVGCQRQTLQWRTGSGVCGSGKTGSPAAMASRKRPFTLR